MPAISCDNWIAGSPVSWTTTTPSSISCDAWLLGSAISPPGTASKTSDIAITLAGKRQDEADVTLAGTVNALNNLDLTMRGSLHDETSVITEGITATTDNLDFLARGVIAKDNEQNIILTTTNPDETDLTLEGVSALFGTVNFILRGTEGRFTETPFALAGKTHADAGLILNTKNMDELGFILMPRAERGRRRFTLLDTISLRTTAVYRQPRDISYLKLVYGDFSHSRIPCTPLDRDGYIHHASDIPMQTISGVYVDGEPKSHGLRAYSSYQDETGRGIACVVFDNPQYNKRVSVSGRGAINLETGDLIENPTDIIRDVFLHVQKYDEDSLDLGELARFYADCLREELRLALLIQSPVTMKSFLDDLSLNTHSHSMVSDGKSVMRLRW